MKRILLINTNTENSPYPVPPLGLCLVASRLENDYDISLFDAASGTIQQLTGLLQQFNPDYIGISIRNIDNVFMERPVYYLNDINEKFISTVKKHSKATVIFGGSGFSIFPEEVLQLPS